MHLPVVRIATLSIVTGLAPAAALADLVDLDNGDRLSGTVLRKTDGTLLLRTDYAGELKLDWARIVGLSTTAPVSVMRKDAEELMHGRLAAGAPGEVLLLDDAGAARNLALADLRYLNPTPDLTGRGTVHGGRAALSASLVSGNSDSDHVHGEAEFTARAQGLRHALGVRASRRTDAGAVVASNWLATGQRDRYLDAGRFWYARASAEKDRFKDLRLRSTLGAGYGRQWIETPLTHLSLRGGLDYVVVDRLGGANEDYPAFGWGVKAGHKFAADGIELFHDQEGFARVTDLDQISLRTRSGVRVPLRDGLTGNVQLNLDWEREPAPGRSSTDTTWLLGMGYAW